MAYNGRFNFSALAFTQLGAGARNEFGTILPPGGRVSYVRSSGPADGDPADVKERLYTTLNAALGQCRSGYGDIVYVLPGHAENVASADQMSALVAGTRIIGCGHGNLRPTFTWTTANSTFLLDVANVTIENCILNLESGAGTGGSPLAVTAPITISAAGCAIRGCKIRMGTDANNTVAIGITTTAAADDLEIIGNEIYGATAAEATTGIQFVGADRLKFMGNSIVMATSAAAVGVIRFLTTASTDIKMFHNVVRNNKASSSQAITGMAGLTGEVDFLQMAVLSDAAGALTGAFSTPASLVFGSNTYITNNIAERAALFGTLSA